MARNRKGSMYEAMLSLMGRPPKPKTKLKKPPKPKSSSGGGKSSGGSISKPKGGSKTKMPSFGKAGRPKKGKTGPSQAETNGQGVKQTPAGLSISPEEINESPRDRRARMRAEDRAASKRAREGEDVGETAGGAGSPSDPVRAANSSEPPIDIPDDDESPYDRRARMRSEARRAARDQRDRDAGYDVPEDEFEKFRPRARDRKRGSGAYRKGDPSAMPEAVTRPEPSVSAEQELGIVQKQISTPRPEDVEILMSNPQKYIGPFIEAFGEENVPVEAWADLESPTGPAQSAYPYPGAAPPSAPPPPPGTYPPATAVPMPGEMPPGVPPEMMPPGAMPPRMMPPPMPSDEDFLPEEMRRPKMPY